MARCICFTITGFRCEAVGSIVGSVGLDVDVVGGLLIEFRLGYFVLFIVVCIRYICVCV